MLWKAICNGSLYGLNQGATVITVSVQGNFPQAKAAAFALLSSADQRLDLHLDQILDLGVNVDRLTRRGN